MLSPGITRSAHRSEASGEDSWLECGDAHEEEIHAR